MAVISPNKNLVTAIGVGAMMQRTQPAMSQAIVSPIRGHLDPSGGGGAAVPGTLYLENGRTKAKLDGAVPTGGRIKAIET